MSVLVPTTAIIKAMGFRLTMITMVILTIEVTVILQPITMEVVIALFMEVTIMLTAVSRKTNGSNAMTLE